jgi:hypothetical protein
MPDEVRDAAGLPLGEEGEFYVGSDKTGFKGQGRDPSVIDYNEAPLTQHSLWCGWTVTENGQGIEWDGSEKFYCYVQWIEYIIANFLKRWGYVLNGTVRWRGDEFDDAGKIEVISNVIKVKRVVWWHDSELPLPKGNGFRC